MKRYLEGKLWDATRRVDGNYVRELQKAGGISRAIESTNDLVKKHSRSSALSSEELRDADGDQKRVTLLAIFMDGELDRSSVVQTFGPDPFFSSLNAVS
ncbi:hypothetical protein ACLOJK_038603, partial [Asimina triloba]